MQPRLLKKAVASGQRHSPSKPCPKCGGVQEKEHPTLPHCWGFVYEDGRSFVCTQSDEGAVKEIRPGEWLHRLEQPGITLQEYADHKRLPVEFIKSLGVSEIFYDKAPALRIPYLNSSGEAVAIRFRIALKGSERFRWKNGSRGSTLYGANVLKDFTDDLIVLCEGESDCHTLWYHDIPAVGLPGASTWKEEWAEDLKKFKAIYVIIEPDSGGENVKKWLAQSSIRSRVKLVSLKGFKDPSELHTHNPDGFKKSFESFLAAAVQWLDEEERERREKREAAWEKCEAIASAPDILDRFIQSYSKFAVGEERLARLVYLALSSRFLKLPISVIVKGASSAGKSFNTDVVLKFFPPSAYYQLSAMSDRALAYTEESLSNRFLYLNEANAMHSDFLNYILRTLLSEGRIVYLTLEPGADRKMRNRLISKEGPTGLIVTTTAVKIHHENETRMLSIPVNDSPEQTKKIMLKQAQRVNESESFDYSEWHAFQDWLGLSEHRVHIPFAQTLAELIPPFATRLRRDFPALLNLIWTHAMLHQASRERDANGFVIATIDDYSAVRKLVADLISEGAEASIPEDVRRVVKAVEDIIDGQSFKSASVTEIAQRCQINKATVSRWVKKAGDYLKNLETQKGRPAQLRVGEPLPVDRAVLPTIEELTAACNGTTLCNSGRNGTKRKINKGLNGSVAVLHRIRKVHHPSPSPSSSSSSSSSMN